MKYAACWLASAVMVSGLWWSFVWTDDALRAMDQDHAGGQRHGVITRVGTVRAGKLVGWEFRDCRRAKLCGFTVEQLREIAGR